MEFYFRYLYIYFKWIFKIFLIKIKGIVATLVAVSITHPLDVIRTRLSCDFTKKYEKT